MRHILLCSDLDRTLIPNGTQPESPQARPLLHSLTTRPELTLAYVSGRHLALLLAAIRDYDLPVPDYAIGDVGTTIYEIHNNEWRPWQAWTNEIAPDWAGKTHDELAQLFVDLEVLSLQEPEKQNTFKLSYYAPPDIDHASLLKEMQRRLLNSNVGASLIWSIDEEKHSGLLDVLPERATKYHAIHFLMTQKGFVEGDTVFAGDSGNDLPVLTSGLQAVLVHNARADVRETALSTLKDKGLTKCLYLAQGGFLGLNGNYAGGVLEGLAHFIPEAKNWLAASNTQALQSKT